MSDLISREDAVKAIRKCKFESVMPSDWYRGMECAQDIVEDVPSAELTLQTPQTYGKSINPSNAEVVSADAVQGEWVDVENEPYCECSVCGSYIDNLDDNYAFCPRCGVKMYKGGAE